ncbi:hypothetical protein BKI52_39760 [marine bacterium AO1-C]|nr:hypothetical protein BKI52_39760 [marine bacterium AO1-C]
MDNIQEKYMRKSIELGQQALQEGNAPVGSVIVHQNKIIGQGIEAGKTANDVTYHAEILAVRDAIKNGYQDLLKDATMYTTHEPCIMCSYVIRHHKIPQIVYGLPVDFIGGHSSQFGVLNTEEVPNWGHKPVTIGGVLLEECAQLSKAYEQTKK